MRPIVTCTRFEELVLREASGVELARPLLGLPALHGPGDLRALRLAQN